VASRSGTVVEPGPPPIITPQGIVLVYNGADDHLVYSTGWVLFDKKDPTKVLAWFLWKEWSAREIAGSFITAVRIKHVGVATAPAP
jgi:hypothetical protein